MDGLNFEPTIKTQAETTWSKTSYTSWGKFELMIDRPTLFLQSSTHRWRCLEYKLQLESKPKWRESLAYQRLHRLDSLCKCTLSTPFFQVNETTIDLSTLTYLPTSPILPSPFTHPPPRAVSLCKSRLPTCCSTATFNVAFTDTFGCVHLVLATQLDIQCSFCILPWASSPRRWRVLLHRGFHDNQLDVRLVFITDWRVTLIQFLKFWCLPSPSCEWFGSQAEFG